MHTDGERRRRTQMATTLDYESSTRTRRGLMPAMLIALVCGPVLAAGSAVLSCSLALHSWPLSPANLSYSITWGAACGVVGGLLTALVAGARRRSATRVSVGGCVVIAAASGSLLFGYASMLAAV